MLFALHVSFKGKKLFAQNFMQSVPKKEYAGNKLLAYYAYPIFCIYIFFMFIILMSDV